VQDQPGLALPREDEDEKPKLDGPTKEDSQKKISAKQRTKQDNKEQQSILSSDKAHTAGKGCAESKKAAANTRI
jgi:hypothetical protein